MVFPVLMPGHPINSFLVCQDRKSTRLNSSHGYISYAVFCLKKKKNYSSINRVVALKEPYFKRSFHHCLVGYNFANASSPRMCLLSTIQHIKVHDYCNATSL